MSELLSHKTGSEDKFEQELKALKKRHAGNHQYEKLLDELCECDLGKFLIANRGIDGYWTDVVVNYPQRGKSDYLGNTENFHLGSLGEKILSEAPTFLATQQRYQIFRQQIQKELPHSRRLLSVPSGLMSELVSLDYSDQDSVELFAVDLDKNVLKKIEDNAKTYNFKGHIQLFEADAWNFTLDNPVDLVTSNGLNIYVEQDEKVEALYKQFCHLLKPHGRLVGSFITPPDSWDINMIDSSALQLQKSVFVDLLGANWQQYRTEKLTREQLERAGFIKIEFIYDDARIFPTFVATRGK